MRKLTQQRTRPLTHRRWLGLAVAMIGLCAGILLLVLPIDAPPITGLADVPMSCGNALSTGAASFRDSTPATGPTHDSLVGLPLSTLNPETCDARRRPYLLTGVGLGGLAVLLAATALVPRRRRPDR